MGLNKQLRSPAEGEFLFAIDQTPLEETLTSFGGLPLFVRAARSLGVAASVQRNLPLKQRRRGLDEASYIESFLVLNALAVRGKTESRVNRNVGARHAVPACSTYRNMWVCRTLVTRSLAFTTGC